MDYWIDTDPGVDDALAILLAIREVGHRIVGFSSVHGNFAESITARNLARLVLAVKREGLLGADWSPIVARGSRASLTGLAWIPTRVCGPNIWVGFVRMFQGWNAPRGC